MLGACWTVRVTAAEVVGEPTPLLTTTWNWSRFMPSVALKIVSVGPVEPWYTPAKSDIWINPPVPPAERYHW